MFRCEIKCIFIVNSLDFNVLKKGFHCKTNIILPYCSESKNEKHVDKINYFSFKKYRKKMLFSSGQDQIIFTRKTFQKSKIK